MKKLIILMIVLTMVFSLSACGEKEKPAEATTEEKPATSSEPNAEENTEAAIPDDIELVGPWHLSGEKNDLKAFQNIFPGFAEFGETMEIRSNGQISWYIGAEGGSGTYTKDGDTITAELNGETDSFTTVFHVLVENGTPVLEMKYNDTTIYWVYGESEDIPAAGE